MPKVPEPVEWLLGFFNINSIPGEYNPRKLLYSKRPDRTPTVPPENPETGYITDHKGYVYVPGFDNEPYFLSILSVVFEEGLQLR